MITLTNENNHFRELVWTTFPDGTIQVWKVPLKYFDTPSIHVEWEYSNDAEFFALAQLKDLLDAHSIWVDLTIYYLPYARQDKEISNETTFGLRTFAKLLNSLSFRTVNIFDPHSQIALDIIDNSEAMYPGGDISDLFEEQSIDYLCYPDSGAQEKYSKIYDHPSIHARKLRDPLTGDILEVDLIGLDEPGKRVLIVDDICDGGATFVRLAKALKEKGASYVGLYVSYALMTKGDGLLYNAGIDRIYQAINLRRARNE